MAQELRLPLATLLRSLLAGDVALLRRLAVKATVPETYFFRHPEHFAALVDHVVPALVQGGQHSLRAWSAGSATGEEAYSLAAALHFAAPQAEVAVLATDVNEDSLAVGAAGRYSRHSLRAEQPYWARSWPLQVSASSVEVPTALRALVRFHALNLHQPNYPEEVAPHSFFDVIFCRNVLVYFSAEAAAKVLLRLRDCLRPGGYLFLAALDYTATLPGLLPVTVGGVSALRRELPGPKVAPKNQRRISTPPPRDLLGEAKAAADCGDHEHASRLLREALATKRTPEVLHLLALVRRECGQRNETLALLTEATTLQHDYALGHLSLGLLLLESAPRDEARARRHLEHVLELLIGRSDAELLRGPETLAIGLARRLATTALARPTGEPH